MKRGVGITGSGPTAVGYILRVKRLAPEAMRRVRADLILTRLPFVIRDVDDDQEDAALVIPALVRGDTVGLVVVNQLAVHIVRLQGIVPSATRFLWLAIWDHGSHMGEIKKLADRPDAIPDAARDADPEWPLWGK